LVSHKSHTNLISQHLIIYPTNQNHHDLLQNSEPHQIAFNTNYVKPLSHQSSKIFRKAVSLLQQQQHTVGRL